MLLDLVSLEPARIEDLIRFVGSSVLSYVPGSDGPAVVECAAPVTSSNAGRDAISFISSTEPDVVDELLHRTRCGVILCAPSRGITRSPMTAKPHLITVEKPRLWFGRILSAFQHRRHVEALRAPSAWISPAATIGAEVAIGHFTAIHDCTIGDNCTIDDNCTIGDGAVLGKRVSVGPGAVLGYGGFGFERDEYGRLERIPQLSGLVIGDDVEIGSRSVIDRGTLAATVISNGTKIDAGVYVAHNVFVDEHVAIAGGVQILGGVTIGSRSFVGAGSVLRPQIRIGSGAFIAMGSVVTRSVSDNERVRGVPATRY